MKIHYLPIFTFAISLTSFAAIADEVKSNAWTGNIYGGASLSDGNTNEKSAAFDAKIQRHDGDHRYGGYAEYDFQKSNGTRTADEREIGAFYDYFFAPKWFLNGKASLEQDKVNDLDIRSTIGLGIGHQQYDRDDLKLKYILGVDYLHEEYKNTDATDTAAGRWELNYEQAFKDDAYRLFHNHEILVPFDDGPSAFILDSETGIKLPISSGITASAQVDFDWDNDPAAGLKEGDTKYGVSIGYEW